MDTVIRINEIINDFAWGSLGLVLIFGTGIVCTVATGGFQLRYIRHWRQKTFGCINKEGRVINDAGALSQYRAFCMALCATLGTGNIVVVSAAICMGGPGAVFWMWVAAFFGMMIKFSENVLGMYYKRRNAEGAWSGGPMYYLQDGLGSMKHCKKLGKVLAVLFCAFTVLASFGVGNMGQINKITLSIEETFLTGADFGEIYGIPRINWVIGMVLMLVAAFIILGGFRRLAYFSERMIPVMFLSYIIGCLVVIAVNLIKLPAIVLAIFKFALGPEAIAGGAAGTAIQLAFNTIKYGCKRGVFSNEAGLGSSVMVHSNSCAREPVRQGLWGIAEVFLDTMVICTLTAFVVLGSGAVDLSTGHCLPGVNDTTLVSKAFGQALGKPGEWFVVLAITLFAFTTVLGWSYYGSKVVEYLFGVTVAKLYRVIFIALIIFGALLESNLVWDLSDTFNGLMMIPNLIGVLVQTPLVVKLTKNYVDRRIKGMDVTPMLSYNKDIQREANKAVERGLA